MVQNILNLFIHVVVLYFILFFDNKIKNFKYKRTILFFSFLLLALYDLGYIYVNYMYLIDNIYFYGLFTCFIAAMILDNKESLLYFIVVSTLLIFLLKVIFGLNNIYVLIEIFNSAIFIFVGRICNIYLYDKGKVQPSLISAFVYAIILVSIYGLMGMVLFAFTLDEMKFTGEGAGRIILAIFYAGIYIFIIFWIMNKFHKRDDKEDSRLIRIFLKNCILLILIFCILSSIFSFIFNCIDIYMEAKGTMLNYYNFIKKEMQNERNRYGDNYFDLSEKMRDDYNSIMIDDYGYIFILDEQLKFKNKLAFEKSGIAMDDFDYIQFDDILEYPQDELVKYKKDNNMYYIMYSKIGSVYFLLFAYYSKIFSKALVPTLSSIFLAMINALIVVLEIFFLIKRFFVNKIDKINYNLKEIAAGKYDIILEEKNIEEFKELSSSINETVTALKTSIKEVEDKTKEELDLARKIQNEQLPIIDDNYIAYDVYAKNISAEDVGGDFYDCIEIDKNHTLFLVADVSSKGIPAAMFMMKAKNAISNFARLNYSLKEIVRKANYILCEKNDAMMFVTCFICILDLKTGELEYINAGHNPPLIGVYKNCKTEYEYVEVSSNNVLGIDIESEYTPQKMIMQKKDKVFIYSDGVTESRNNLNEFFGEERLKKILDENEDNTAKKILENVYDNILKFSNGVVQYDDITMLCFSYVGSKNKIVLNTTIEDMEKGKRLFNKFLNLYNVKLNTIRDLMVVYAEIFTNIMSYAYGENIGEIIFQLDFTSNKEVEMIFKDKGFEFDTAKYESKELTPEEKINGGMGISICKQIMQRIEYERIDNYNILKMYKEIPE